MARPAALAIAAAVVLGGCTYSPARDAAPTEERVGASRANPGCDSPLYPGPRTLCPDGQAVRRLVEDAGFDVFASVGGSWRATDHETASFSVSWGKGSARSLRRYPIIERIAGVRIRGPRGQQLVWHAAGYTWWLTPQGAPPADGPGPHPWTLRLPSGDVLEPLVRASMSADLASSA